MIGAFSYTYAQENNEDGFRIITNTQEDPKSKYNAKYSPNSSSYCSATLISPNVGLTAKHCVGNHKMEGNIGSIYPGQSGIETPFGSMSISTYIPDVSQDIAIIKGSDNDKSASYINYINNFNLDIKPFTLEDLKKLKEKKSKVYSYGYPYDFAGGRQVKATGEITNYNQVTLDVDTNIPVSEGQSGAGVFLEDGRFLGVLSKGFNKNNKDYARVVTMNERLVKWFNKNNN